MKLFKSGGWRRLLASAVGLAAMGMLAAFGGTGLEENAPAAPEYPYPQAPAGSFGVADIFRMPR